MKNSNIVIFSSGVSEKHGITEIIKSKLTDMGYICMDWRNLFSSANNSDRIALLPLLIKKIPTFDFAILICEGHDITHISRGQNSETVKTMRDNVLFEIGLCAMAIGLNRTIIVSDNDVRMPDDLQGVDGDLAIKRIAFDDAELEQKDMTEVFCSVCAEIDSYIKQESDHLNQIVIGAAASGACGYASNFICRTLEHIDDEIIIKDGKNETVIRISPDKVYMHIGLPNNLDGTVINRIKEKQGLLLTGCVPTARSRPAEFRCFFSGDELHIVDYPTNVVTSYDTARIILEIDADDSFDDLASERFVSKEMTLYEVTLRDILCESFVRNVIDEHYGKSTDEEKDRYCRNVMSVISGRLTVERFE